MRFRRQTLALALPVNIVQVGQGRHLPWLLILTTHNVTERVHPWSCLPAVLISFLNIDQLSGKDFTRHCFLLQKEGKSTITRNFTLNPTSIFNLLISDWILLEIIPFFVSPSLDMSISTAYHPLVRGSSKKSNECDPGAFQCGNWISNGFFLVA